MIVGILGRPPTTTELALYAVMWSEHCSYKSSRVHLARLPTEAPHVLVGPGENAGVIDAGDGIAVAIRIESHNHPSAIEPYQGAATGRRRDPARHLHHGGAAASPSWTRCSSARPTTPASAGSSSRGWCAGSPATATPSACPPSGARSPSTRPTGQNPLVNVLCLGVLPIERLVLASASGVGNLAVLLGSATGRDGIGGVSVLASAGFAEKGAAEERRSARASRSATPTRRSGSSRPASSCSTPASSSGSRTSAAPACRAPRARPRRTRGWGWTSTSPRVPRREPRHEPGRGDDEREPGAHAGHRRRRARSPRWQEVCAAGRCGPTVDRRRHRARRAGGGRLRILDGFDGRGAGRRAGRSLADDAPLYDRPLAPPADLDGAACRRPGAPARARRLRRATCWRCSPIPALGLPPVRPPAVPEHGRSARAGRRRRAALAAPGIPSGGKALADDADSNPRWCALDPRAGTAATVAESAAQRLPAPARSRSPS